MDTLQSLVHGYLESADYNFLETREGFLVADKLVLGGARDTRLLWIVPTLLIDDEDFPQLERRLLREFADRISQYPNASRWLVTHMRGEFSKEFQSEVTRLGFAQRAEIEFFDAPFKVDENPQATSAIRSLRDLAIHQQRVPQPYSVLADGEPQEKGDDLLYHLLELDELRAPEGSCLRIIIGPAGAGKSMLFRALFSSLYEYFREQKTRREVFPRPVPLIPDHLRRATALRLRELINRFIHEDVAVPIPRSTFEWMLTHGYAIWLFDGLDELYAGDQDFFNGLADLLTRPGSQAQILICARESLLTSCETFAEFLKEYPPGQETAIRLYRLDDWDRYSKRAFAWLRFEGYVPTEKRLVDPLRVSQFLTYTERSDSLKSLSSLPYYCELLLRAFEQGNPAEFSDDFDLIAYAVSEIIEREEKGKKLLSLEHFQDDGLNEWLETVASEFYGANFKGVDKADVETYAMLVLHPELSEEERCNTITTLVQFPLFASGPEPRVITFEHELIAEYLAGRYWLKRFTGDPGRVARELGAPIDFADSLIGRYMANLLPKEPGGIQALIAALRREALPGRAFANLLELLLLATPARDVLKNHGIAVEGRDLSHMRFMGRNLEGFSFRNCNLSNTTFRDCNLQDAQFEGAHLIGTKFEKLSEEALEGTRFGSLEHFESIQADQRRIEDRSMAIEWVQRVTGRIEPIQQPCPAALQLRTLFLKFVRPDGSGRRADLPESALTGGKRHSGAPPAEDCVRACLILGYLQGPDFRHRIKRTPGDRYSDMVHFVRDWQLSADIRQMLDSLCPETGCEHVPGSY